MKAVKAFIIQPYAMGRKAQVVVHYEPGTVSPGKTSVTRHAVRLDSRWIGFNPDPRAPRERNLAEVAAAVVEGEVRDLKGRIAEIEAENEGGQEPNLAFFAIRLRAAELALDVLKAEKERAHQQFPTKVEFVLA